MKLKRTNRIIMVLLLFTLILGQSSLAFAGKPAPVVKSAIDITTTGFSVTIPEDTNYAFSVNLTSSIPNFSWAVTPLDPSLTYSLNAIQIKTSKRSTSYLQTANFVYSPIDDDTAKNATFVISASDGGTVNKDQITVTFNVTPVVEQVTFDYVALGDSIPNGVSYEYNIFGNIITSYTDLYSDYLRTKHENVTYTDLSVSGYNSIDVLNQLRNDNYRTVLENAEVITLCIGANDLMDAAKDGFLGSINFYDIAWTDDHIPDNNTDITYISADTGRANFETNWPQIIQKIYELNPTVKLMVTTIYNPYNTGDDHSYNTDGVQDPSLKIHYQVDQYLWNDSELKTGINTIITNYANLGPLQYQVIQVNEYFEYFYTNNMGAVTGFYNGLVQDPHPDVTGQQIIFKLHTGELTLTQ